MQNAEFRKSCGLDFIKLRLFVSADTEIGFYFAKLIIQNTQCFPQLLIIIRGDVNEKNRNNHGQRQRHADRSESNRYPGVV